MLELVLDIFFFLDAEKTSDNLNWTFLFKILEETFIQWKKIYLYFTEVQKIVNGDLSIPCEEPQGARHCAYCLLLILALEIFRNIKQRQSNRI